MEYIINYFVWLFSWQWVGFNAVAIYIIAGYISNFSYLGYLMLQFKFSEIYIWDLIIVLLLSLVPLGVATYLLIRHSGKKYFDIEYRKT